MNPHEYYEFEYNEEPYVVPREWFEEHDKQIRADERNNVLSTLKKLIDSDYKSKDCQLLFCDLCEWLLDGVKEQK